MVVEVLVLVVVGMVVVTAVVVVVLMVILMTVVFVVLKEMVLMVVLSLMVLWVVIMVVAMVVTVFVVIMMVVQGVVGGAGRGGSRWCVQVRRPKVHLFPASLNNHRSIKREGDYLYPPPRLSTSPTLSLSPPPFPLTTFNYFLSLHTTPTAPNPIHLPFPL